VSTPAVPSLVLPGSPHRLGARFDGAAAEFAVFSAHATRVELCLFDGPDSPMESHRIDLPTRTSDVWHGRFEGIAPGQLYGYRVHGPWAPHDGHRFNPSKLLIDPCARALCGPLRWNSALYGHDPDHPERPSTVDSAPFVPRGILVDEAFDWGDDAPPRTPWSRSLIYAGPVRAAPARPPAVAAGLRGRFAGLASPPLIDHLAALGVTAVELLPVHHAGAEEHLAHLGLPNYWGYSTLSFFAPDARFAASPRPGAAVNEFREMVRSFHAAGIEVLLDVVFNHTPEGGSLGPTLSLRGLDNASYYRLHASDRAEYTDYTGTGNTLNVAHPRVRQLVVDSLRYWAEEMHVDGFRFDLAPALVRDHGEFDPHDRLFEIVRQDPVLAQVKLVAEPWDLGPEGYRLGGFPLGWSEWNDRFRDVTRRFWRGDSGQVAELASRFAGSSDVFPAERGPTASVNYVCSHDGFTLRDLVSYARKHNEANGEGGRDGPHDESANWGAEGPSRSARVVRMRNRARRNFVATLALACGVPMWLGGDELGRTQGGNNNAYCQDNETSWLDWQLDAADAEFFGFVRHCFEVRRQNAVFRRHRHLGEDRSETLRWLRPDGEPMKAADWAEAEARAFALLLAAESGLPHDEAGAPQASRAALVLWNGDSHTHAFQLAAPPAARVWIEQINTACSHGTARRRAVRMRLAPHSLVLLEAADAAARPDGGRA